jgi:hypothetical protein
MDLLWICQKVEKLWSCCGFAVQLIVQQIHNKSNKWSLTPTPLVQFLVDLLWICYTTSCTTCRKVVDLLCMDLLWIYYTAF